MLARVILKHTAMNKTSDYINFDTTLNKGLSLLKDNKKFRIGFYIIFSINTGLRISDTLSIRHIDMADDKLVIKEKKTKKRREITLNEVVKKAYSKLVSKLDELNIKYDEDEYIFVSQKGSVYRTQSINDILKTIFNSNSLQVSSHSLRKSFARRVYDVNNKDENSLVLLSDIFSHTSVAITRKYLGLRAQEIQNVYLTLNQ